MLFEPNVLCWGGHRAKVRNMVPLIKPISSFLVTVLACRPTHSIGFLTEFSRVNLTIGLKNRLVWVFIIIWMDWLWSVFAMFLRSKLMTDQYETIHFELIATEAKWPMLRRQKEINVGLFTRWVYSSSMSWGGLLKSIQFVSNFIVCYFY